MSDNSDARPWHGADSPFEAFYQWVKAELDAIRSGAPTPKAPDVAADAVSEAAPEAPASGVDHPGANPGG